jgi:dienelactone hydrolase
MTTLSSAFLVSAALMGQVREHPGGRELSHEKYIHVVSEADSPVERAYIQSKDGLYVAAAVRKPKGDGPFPALIHFHGAPGGRGMEKLVTWSRGDTGGPVWERFLQEGYVVVVADYRNPAGGLGRIGEAVREGEVSYADDGVAVVEHVRRLPYVDPERITLYGVSLGGDVVMHTAARTKVAGVILGAGAPFSFLGASRDMTFDEAKAEANVAKIECPVLILVGTSDRLIEIDRALYERLRKAGKPARLEIYANGYHDFVMGPQGHEGRAEPLLDATLDALEVALKFAADPRAGP